MTNATQNHLFTTRTQSKGKVLALAGISVMAVASLTACQKAPSKNDSAASASATNGNGVSLLNVSYDVSRELYKEYNPIFTGQQKQAVTIQQSHGGSSKQALSVANGLKADVVTMNQTSDIELLVKKGLVDKNWQQAFPNNAVPYTSTMVLLVRNNNPKQIKDWDDLAKPGVSIVIANPKTSGTARYGFLGAYGYGLHHFNNDEAKTKALVKQILSNVAVYDSGARAATTSFLQREIGDVLITTENEAQITKKEFADKQLQIVYPSYSVKINNPVAVVNAVTEQKGTTELAKAYLKGLWDTPAQEIMAKNYLRPVDAAILAKYQSQFPAIATFEPNQVFGSWDEIMSKFFKDGAIFDQLAVKK